MNPDRRDVENAAAAALHHAGQERAAQRHHRLDVEPDHLDLPLDRDLEEAPAGPHARVVDQQIHDLSARGDLLRDAVPFGRVGEVRGDPLDANAVLVADLGGHVAQAVGAARHQGERVAPAGKLTGKRNADARGRPGDQGGRGGGRVRTEGSRPGILCCRRCHRANTPSIG
jgi:hypothetical protein